MDITDADFSALWQRTLDTCGADADLGKLSEVERSRTIKTPDDLAAFIEASGRSFTGFRSRHERLWSTLKNFVSPISAVASIAVTPTSLTGFGLPVSAVLGAVAQLVKACDGVSQAYDWIEQVFRGEMQDFSDRLTQYLSTPVDLVLKKKIFAILCAIFKLIKRADHLVRKGRFLQYLHVTFLGADAKTKELIDALNQELGGEQRYILALTYASTQRSSAATQKIQETTSDTYDAVKQVGADVKKALDNSTQADEEAVLKRVLCNTAAFDDVEEAYAQHSRNLLEGTGAWLQNETFFGSWLSHRAPILWIFGGPGSGKTYLSTWVVKKLLEKPDVDRDGLVAYFFVKEDNENLREANVILKTLAWQLTRQDPAFRKHAAAICAERIRTLTAEDTWQNIFLAYYISDAHSVIPATLLVDGLDEATPVARRTILGLLKDLVSLRAGAKRPSLRFAIIGRPSLRGDVNFRRLEKSCIIEVSRLKNKEDIDRYIKKRLQDVQVLWEMRKMKPDGLKKANRFGSTILKKVSDGADGMFLWAKLLLDSLVNKDQRQIESILVSPPSTLDDMIWSVFSRLTNDDDIDHTLLRKMLLVCAYARRPLEFAELYAAISLPDRTPNYLLWKQTRGVLSSVFELKFPNGVDPDDEEGDDDEGEEEAQGSQVEAEEEEEEPFDFSDTGDDDAADQPDASDDSEEPGFGRTQSQTRASQGQLSPSEIRPEAGIEPGETEIDGRTDATEGGMGAGEDFLSCLSDGQRHTDITFSHAWIREYLVREGTAATRRKPQLAVLPATRDAQVELTIACIELYRLEPYRKEEEHFLSDYALCHMPFHLEAVDWASVPQDKAVRVVEGLYWLFGTDRGALCMLKAVRDYDEFHSYFDTFWHLWVGTDHYLRLAQAWFGKADAFKGQALWDEAMVDWMGRAATSMQDLLRPLMLTASRLWLTRPGLDSTDCIDKGEFPAWLMHSWLTWVETGSSSPFIRDFSWRRDSHAFETVTPDRLEHLANWAGLAHDVHWHSDLGWMLMNGAHYDAAESQYRQAVQVEPRAWVALEGLARCEGEQGRLKEAVAWQEQAISALPSPLSSMAGYLWFRISDWAEQLGDADMCYRAGREGYAANDMSIPALETYIRELNKRSEYETVVKTLEELSGLFDGPAEYSLLTRFFMFTTQTSSIGDACRTQGKPEFVLDAMDQAEGLAENQGDTWQLWLSHAVAYFKYNYYGLVDEAVRLFEKFLAVLARLDKDIQDSWETERRQVTIVLSQLYFDIMVEDWSRDATSRPLSADKLKKLAVVVSTGSGEDYEGFDLFQGEYPSMLWGRWLRDYMKADASVWRRCFRARLLKEMKRLDDDDPTNDTQGLTHLAITLFHAGDRRNAAAILAIMFKGAEEAAAKASAAEADKTAEPSEEATSGETKQEDSGGLSERAGPPPAAKIADYGPSSSRQEAAATALPASALRDLSLVVGADSYEYSCENCGRMAPEVAELYFCEVCYDTNWCGECLALLRQGDDAGPGADRGSLACYQCNPRHDFYRAWPIPDEARYVAAQSFEIGVVVRKAWLEKLRGEWLDLGAA